MLLLDSNIIIYASQPQHQKLRRMLAEDEVAVSVISKIEVLGFARLDPEDARFFRTLFDTVRVIELSSAIVERAIELRQQRRMSLGDAVIAATALIQPAKLITRNCDDFRWIVDLHMHNPLEPETPE